MNKILVILTVLSAFGFCQADIILDDFEGYSSWADMTANGWYNWHETQATASLDVSGGIGGSKALKSVSLIDLGGSASLTLNLGGSQDWSSCDSVSIMGYNPAVNYTVGQHVSFVALTGDGWANVGTTGTIWNFGSSGNWEKLSITIDDNAGWKDVRAVKLILSQYYLNDTLLFDNITLVPEPASIALFGFSAISCLFFKRRK